MGEGASQKGDGMLILRIVFVLLQIILSILNLIVVIKKLSRKD
jgi:hypothetical protein